MTEGLKVVEASAVKYVRADEALGQRNELQVRANELTAFVHSLTHELEGELRNKQTISMLAMGLHEMDEAELIKAQQQRDVLAGAAQELLDRMAAKMQGWIAEGMPESAIDALCYFVGQVGPVLGQDEGR